jgi:predicted RNase H-like nuclease (RuvC/YqgF family)
MISELKDEEILDFLMTSDFEQEYKSEELKYLLVKWRYFYRVLNGKFELQKTNSNYEIEHLQEEIKRLKAQILENQSIIAEKENKINTLESRKLTFKERLSGKIINKDENK